jgi:hypothetical protein
MRDLRETTLRHMPVKKLVWANTPDRWSLQLTRDPIPHNHRVLTNEQRDMLGKQLQEWIALGVVSPVLRGFPCQPVFAKRKSGRVRVCIDSRPVNEVTMEFEWPLPRLQDMRHRIRGYSWFASIDLKDAFHRIHIPAHLRKWVTLATPWGLVSFNRLTFGLTTAPSYFQRYLDHLLQSEAQHAMWYQDDILIMGHTRQQVTHHWNHTKRLLRGDGNRINEEKSTGPTQEITWCGLHLTPHAIKAGNPLARNIPVPYNKKDRQSALGWLNYFRDHIPNLSYYTEQVTPNQHNQTRSQQYEKDWHDLIERCAQTVDLNHWTRGKPADLYNDASAYAMGGMLMQQGRVIALWSKKLSPAQVRYSTTDREHLALATSAYKFQVFLQDRTVQTTVHTDHASLLNRDWRDLRPIQVRWCLTIQRYIRCLQHVKGEKNPADFLSRKGMGG